MLGSLFRNTGKKIPSRGASSSHRRSAFLSKSGNPKNKLSVQKTNISRRNYASSELELSESFLNGTTAAYVEDMFVAWKQDPSSVHASWASYFKLVESGAAPGEGFAIPPTLAPGSPHYGSGLTSSASSQSVSPDTADRLLQDHMKLYLLVRAYQVRGHFVANIDPLELTIHERPAELTLEHYGFTKADLEREFYLSGTLAKGILANAQTRKLKDIVASLEKVYCNTIGIEYMHIQDREEANWLRARFEVDNRAQFSKEEKLNLLDRLLWGCHFEKFLSLKYPYDKRFGLDGGESFIPGMKFALDHAADLGVSNIVMGMAHRGRLNTLANVVRKPLLQIFHEFNKRVTMQDTDIEEWGASGDVKYHLGTSYNRPTATGKNIHISLLANPSHLEAVNPLVEGKARSKQYYMGDKDGTKCMTIQIHGDASFAGQGIIYETINMSGLPHYTTGGSLHIIINNQIGFTTDPKFSRGGTYCTDVVKGNGAPIFHVNGDDPEAVVFAMKTAVEWRQTFHKDVVVDIVCYRKFGHNEVDHPSFTQPLMYQKIDKMEPIIDKYSKKLIAEGVLTQAEYDEMVNNCHSIMSQGFEDAKSHIPTTSEWLESKWKGFKSPAQLARIKHTGVKMDTLKAIGEKMTTIPEGFTPNPTLLKIIKEREQYIQTGENLDWATAEQLAFGSLLMEGNHVRLAGQDVQRGTFSHRHAAWTDQKTNELYTPLNHIGGKEEIHFVNSCLSEFAAMGFELGYSLENPNSLVLWEGQFGDFVNGAQIIIDQFLSCGEQKWFRQSGLTLLLPHGYEGQGPEHSSCRLERFLQLSDSDPEFLDTRYEDNVQRTNWAVVNCSTPANYFHVLRQQIHREYRKPLVIATPKSLLRHKMARSKLDELDDVGDDTRFQMLIPEISTELVAPEKIQRIIFCSGKVYYDLLDARQKKNEQRVAIVRVEQLAPFPFSLTIEELKKYPNAQVVWCQEEPKNMGAWHYVYFALKSALRSIRGNSEEPKYVGRHVSASPATGFYEIHTSQLNRFLNEAFTL